MMDSVKTFFKNFIKYFLYIAVFAQIVSGTVYLVCNFTVFTAYPETEEMVNAARNLIIDEYIGFLYPLFIRMCLGIQDFLGIGYYLVAHLVQLLVFFVSIMYVTKPFFKGRNWWISGLLVTTFPMCVQSILMVAPYSFKASFGFFIIGAMVRIWKQKEGLCIKAFIVMLAAYIMSCFNQPDDLYLWIVPIGILEICLLCRKREKLSWYKKVSVLLAIVVVFVGAFFVGEKMSDMGARGRMHKSVYSVMFQRTLWPDLRMKYGFLPGEIQSYITSDEAISSNRYAEDIVYYIGPKIEQQVGFDRADELYKEAVKNQFSYNKRAIFKALSNDFVGYLLEPYTSIWHMNGQSGSAFGKLYSLMCGNGNAGVYGYFCVSFVTLFSLSFVGILNVVKHKLFAKKGIKKAFVLLTGLLMYHALWYAIVNVQGIDYRFVLLHIGIYILLALKGGLFIKEDVLESKKGEKESVLREIPKKTWFVLGGVLAAVVLVFVGVSVVKKGYKESDMLKDKVAVCFGDSIWGLIDDETGIARLLEKMTGVTVHNYAISGTTASDTRNTEVEDEFSKNSLMCMLEKSETILEGADYLILAYGLNDYFKGIPAKTEETLDVSTYQGALRYTVETIKEKYPDLQIVFIGQTYCQFYSYGMVKDDSDTTNYGGGVGTDYVNAAKEVAMEYELLFVNMYEELPMDEWNGQLYLEDATHLNENGRREYAKVLANYLLRDYEERNAR